MFIFSIQKEIESLKKEIESLRKDLKDYEKKHFWGSVKNSQFNKQYHELWN